MPPDFRPDLQPFSSFEIIVRDDDDGVFDGVGEDQAAMRGRQMFVRRSMWPALKAELEQLPRMQ
jgi:hypothetical protein